jgi:predicted negative regulator of RcsB-dependent stress response
MIGRSIMEDNTDSSLRIYNFLAWVNDNKKPLIGAVIVFAAAGTAFALYNWNKSENEKAANQALFSLPSPVAANKQNDQIDVEKFVKVATDHKGTSAAERAALIAAAGSFGKGQFAPAKSQFEAVLSNNPDGPFAAESLYGVAASLEGSGDLNGAVAKYQELTTRFAGDSVATQAKLSLGRIYEVQNKPAEALQTYELLASAANQSFWSQEASERREAILLKHPELVKTNPLPTSAVNPLQGLKLGTPAASTNR